MADYGCFPLWETDPDRAGDIDPCSLPIDEALRERLAAWAAAYDSTLNQDDPPHSGFASPAAELDWLRMGDVLAADLQRALGAGVTVTYWHAPELSALSPREPEER